MKKLTVVLALGLTLAGCGTAPGAIAPQRMAPAPVSAMAAVQVDLEHLGSKGNGYTDAYRLTVESGSKTVVYEFDYTPLMASEFGPDGVESRKLTLNGKKVTLKEVEAVAKILQLAYDKVDAKKRKMVTTAVRALTWDL